MTLHDVFFENQWERKLVSRHVIGKQQGIQVGTITSRSPTKLPYFKIPNEKCFYSHPLIAATLAQTTQRAYISAFQDFQRFHGADLASKQKLSMRLLPNHTKKTHPQESNRKGLISLNFLRSHHHIQRTN